MKTKTQTFWTEESEQRLKHLVEVEKLSTEEIRLKMGFDSRGKVIAKVHRMGLRMARSTGDRSTPVRVIRRAVERRSSPDIARATATPEAPGGMRDGQPVAVGPVVTVLRQGDFDHRRAIFGVDIIEVTGCRWPVAGDRLPVFCNSAKRPGESYCAAHSPRSVGKYWRGNQFIGKTGAER